MHGPGEWPHPGRRSQPSDGVPDHADHPDHHWPDSPRGPDDDSDDTHNHTAYPHTSEADRAHSHHRPAARSDQRWNGSSARQALWSSRARLAGADADTSRSR